MDLPNSLDKPISEIKEPEKRVLVICLILAVMACFGLLIRVTYSKDSSSEKQIEKLERMLAEKDATIKLKDSTISACGRELLTQAYKSAERLGTREIINNNKK